MYTWENGLATYKEHIIDAKKHNEIDYFEIPEDGIVVLYPHIFYLGVTDWNTPKLMPMYLFSKANHPQEGLGIDIHATAGKGDVGFLRAIGRWRSR